jgi:hypothetical protein
MKPQLDVLLDIMNEAVAVERESRSSVGKSSEVHLLFIPLHEVRFRYTRRYLKFSEIRS